MLHLQHITIPNLFCGMFFAAQLSCSFFMESAMGNITKDHLIENAKDFVQIGFEDYLHDEDKRNKSAIRNIYCGIELLMKAYILKYTEDICGDALIYKENKPFFSLQKNGLPSRKKWKTSLVGYGQTISLDTKKIKNTLEPLEVVPKEELTNTLKILKDSERVKDIRNQLEHAHIDFHSNLLKHVILDSYIIAKDFLKIHGHEFSKLLDNNKNEELRKKIEKYEQLKKSNLEKFCSEQREIAKSLLCVYCKSILVAPTKEQTKIAVADIKCTDCAKTYNFSDLIQGLITSTSFSNTHHALEPLNFFPKEVFSLLDNKQVKTLVDRIKENEQIHWIKTDQDIHRFLVKLHAGIKEDNKFNCEAKIIFNLINQGLEDLI